MERLTYVTEDGEILFHPEDLPEDEGMTIRQLAEDERWKALDQIAEKLANMEQLEEERILLRLPCRIGDIVYVPIQISIAEYKIKSITFNGASMYFKWDLLNGVYVRLDGFTSRDIGKLVFLTREEAEKRVEEMKKTSSK